MARPQEPKPGSDPDRLLPVGQAARALGISLDTLRRWDREGRIRVVRDRANRRMVPASEVERLVGRPPRPANGSRLSARNRLAGAGRNGQTDGGVDVGEIEAGPHVTAAAHTRDPVEGRALA